MTLEEIRLRLDEMHATLIAAAEDFAARGDSAQARNLICTATGIRIAFEWLRLAHEGPDRELEALRD
jgi:hypothetical protein